MIYALLFLLLSHLGMYFFGRFTKGLEMKFAIEDAKELNQRAAEVLATVEPI